MQSQYIYSEGQTICVNSVEDRKTDILRDVRSFEWNQHTVFCLPLLLLLLLMFVCCQYWYFLKHVLEMSDLVSPFFVLHH